MSFLTVCRPLLSWSLSWWQRTRWLCSEVLLFQNLYLNRRLAYIWFIWGNNCFLGLLDIYWYCLLNHQLLVSFNMFKIHKKPWNIFLFMFQRFIISWSQIIVLPWLLLTEIPLLVRGVKCSFSWLELLNTFRVSRRIALLLGFCMSNINHFTVFKGLTYFPEKGSDTLWLSS